MTRNDFSVLSEPWTVTNFYKKLDWVHMLGLVFMPIYGFWAAYTFVPLVTKTAVFAVAYYFFTGLGITAGKLFMGCATIILLEQKRCFAHPILFISFLFFFRWAFRNFHLWNFD